MITKTTDIGVIVGRFQTPRLHEAHLDLIKTVCERHPRTIIVLGLSPIVATRNNPLDLEARRKMIQDTLAEEDAKRVELKLPKLYENVAIAYINDNQSDTAWSANLDRLLAEPHLVGINKTVTLYGSRDSFLKCYHGKHKCEELVPETTVSATEMRKLSGNRVKATADFREGVVWATQNRYPTTFPTIDVAVIDRNNHRLLLARKPNESLYRFVGGFADPDDATYEATAARELKEEATLDYPVERFHYAGSAKINDWRYRSEVDKIKTLFFVVEYTDGEPQAADDIAETKWFSLDLGPDLKKYMMPNHHVLVDLLLKYLGNA